MEQMASQGNSAVKGVDEKFCATCGKIVNIKAEICPHCGVRQGKRVDKTALLLITFFLGGIGAHKFYTKKNLLGALYLLFCWTGIPGLIALIEFIIYACTSNEKLQEKYEASGVGVIIGVVVGAFGLVFIMGILAAIAIPQFIAYQNKAVEHSVRSDLQGLAAAEMSYYAENSRFTSNPADLDVMVSNPATQIMINYADEQCFEAIGSNPQVAEPIIIDCNGLK